MKKTGYDFTRNCFDWAFENPDLNNTNMIALYLWFVEKNNRCGWAEKFSVTASESMSCLGMKSRNTYNKAFNDLVEHKFIFIVTRATNQNTCNVISLNQNLSKREFGERSALDSAIVQREFGTCASSDTINKQGNKETTNNETNKQEELAAFDNFRKQYPGTKLGNETEFSNFKKKHKDFLAVIPNLETAIKNQIKHKEQLKSQGKFVPEWKNLSTWINQRCWEEEIETATQTKKQMVY